MLFKRYILYTATAIPFIHSFSGNSTASAPISTFMCLWAIYIFPGSVYIFPPAEQADPSWEYIIRSQTHECGNLGLRPRYSFSGNICFKFSAFCLCSVASWIVMFLNLKLSLQRRSDLCIHRNESAGPRSQFPHSCICERFKYYHDRGNV